mmetsp:Transcript_8117/g.26743  ORF Transcript_8117/g.26743 Transcript_8117/m.26743 type:complete len:390 (-) Transcript_8117:318-1487(-)
MLHELRRGCVRREGALESAVQAGAVHAGAVAAAGLGRSAAAAAGAPRRAPRRRRRGELVAARSAEGEPRGKVHIPARPRRERAEPCALAPRRPQPHPNHDGRHEERAARRSGSLEHLVFGEGAEEPHGGRQRGLQPLFTLHSRLGLQLLFGRRGERRLRRARGCPRRRRPRRDPVQQIGECHAGVECAQRLCALPRRAAVDHRKHCDEKRPPRLVFCRQSAHRRLPAGPAGGNPFLVEQRLRRLGRERDHLDAKDEVVLPPEPSRRLGLEPPQVADHAVARPARRVHARHERRRAPGDGTRPGVVVDGRGLRLYRSQQAAERNQALVAQREAEEGDAVPRVERLRHALLVAPRRGGEEAQRPRVAAERIKVAQRREAPVGGARACDVRD